MLCLLASTALPSAAGATDRTDPIPAHVGPPGLIDFAVNPSAPGALDAGRYLDVVRRSVARWGDRLTTTTDAVAGARDGQNVIGFHELPDGVLGSTTSFGTGTATTVPPTRTCVPNGDVVDDQSVQRVRAVVRVRLRRDVLRGGRVVRRSRRISVSRYRDRLRSVSLPVSRCRSQAQVLRPTVVIETDVELAPAAVPWQLGPATPSASQWDLESNLLHELGHVSGLQHSRDLCDPSTPMATNLGSGDWWHAADDWSHPGCASSVPPVPTHGQESTEAIRPELGGATLLVNTAVPPSVDQGRFLALAQRVIARAGARFGGVTSTPPQPGDDTNVIGFMPVMPGTYLRTTRTPVRVTVETPSFTSCAPAHKRVRHRVPAKRVVRVAGRRMRRDRLRTRWVTINSYRCVATPGDVAEEPQSTELDLAVDQATIAWEAGPGHPDNGTRMDLESALVQGVAILADAPAGTPCDTTTANAALAFGDWWRSSTDVRRTTCAASPPVSDVKTADGQRRMVPAPGMAVSTDGAHRTVMVVQDE